MTLIALPYEAELAYRRARIQADLARPRRPRRPWRRGWRAS